MNKCILVAIFICSVSVVSIDGIEALRGTVENIRAELLTTIDKTVRALMTSPSVQAFFKAKCATNAQVDANVKTQEATDNMMDCISNVMDSESLSNLTFTRGKDRDRALFGRFCSKSPTLIGCIRDFASTVDVCFDKGDGTTENNSGTVIRRIMEAWLLFSCGGNRLLSYFKKGGSECVASKQSSLSTCSVPINNMLRGSGKFSTRFPSVLFENEQCGILSNTRQCVVNELNSCGSSTATSAAIDYYTTLFDVVRDMSPCSTSAKVTTLNYQQPSFDAYDRATTTDSLSTVFLPVVSALTFILSGVKYLERLVVPTALMPV